MPIRSGCPSTLSDGKPAMLACVRGLCSANHEGNELPATVLGCQVDIHCWYDAAIVSRLSPIELKAPSSGVHRSDGASSVPAMRWGSWTCPLANDCDATM